jgi:hypothetical protein
MRRMGATPAQLAQARACMQAELDEQASAQQPEAFGVWDENWDTFTTFLAVVTQWTYRTLTVTRWAGLQPMQTVEHHRQGLNYAQVWAYLDGCVPRRRRRRLFAELQSMEYAVLEHDREQRVQAGEPADE